MLMATYFAIRVYSVLSQTGALMSDFISLYVLKEMSPSNWLTNEWNSQS